MQKTMTRAMHKNMGSFDRIIRLVLAIVLGSLVISQMLTGITGVITSIIAVILIITSLAGFCPAYLPFGISTLKRNKAKQQPQKKNKTH
jgi:amino acid transporter